MRDRWSAAEASEWYDRRPWLAGCNFIPSTAVNQLEMWQPDTFDTETIERELSWAQQLGFNTVRVFLHDLLWGVDGMASRMDSYLAIAARYGIRTMLVLFDDCWHPGAALGPQPPPVAGRHNSRWLQSPGHDVVVDEAQWPRLEAYVRGVVETLADDARVLAWDLYNEPTNGYRLDVRDAREAEKRRAANREHHLLLLRRVFEWARSAAPSQPLTAGAWLPDREMNAELTALSDVITFHSYEDAAVVSKLIGRLRRHGRPIICTEYMARHRNSRFRTHLPVFKRERVGCYNWGLVNGKTQTHLAWDPRDTKQHPGLWFHDIFRADGRPFDDDEVTFIRSVTRTEAL
jgi:hypothetical protein